MPQGLPKRSVQLSRCRENARKISLHIARAATLKVVAIFDERRGVRPIFAVGNSVRMADQHQMKSSICRSFIARPCDQIDLLDARRVEIAVLLKAPARLQPRRLPQKSITPRFDSRETDEIETSLRSNSTTSLMPSASVWLHELAVVSTIASCIGMSAPPRRPVARSPQTSQTAVFDKPKTMLPATRRGSSPRSRDHSGRP